MTKWTSRERQACISGLNGQFQEIFPFMYKEFAFIAMRFPIGPWVSTSLNIFEKVQNFFW